jgi:WD40 repeat protein
LKFSFCPDSEHIASMDGEGNIILCETMVTLGRILSSPVHGVGSFAFSPCSQKLSVATGRTLKIWKLAGIPPSSATVTCRKDEKTKKIERLDDSKQIETGDDDHRPEGFHSLAFNPNGETLAVADTDGDVYIWDLKHGKQIGETVSTGEPMIVLAFNSEGKTLAASTVFRYSQTEDMKRNRLFSVGCVPGGVPAKTPRPQRHGHLYGLQPGRQAAGFRGLCRQPLLVGSVHGDKTATGFEPGQE